MRNPIWKLLILGLILDRLIERFGLPPQCWIGFVALLVVTMFGFFITAGDEEHFEILDEDDLNETEPTEKSDEQ